MENFCSYRFGQFGEILFWRTFGGNSAKYRLRSSGKENMFDLANVVKNL
jgi:hypothetical protein